ncbi:hypothetical protein BKA65DRAFT_556825 [Rhexocercosporidium sp. MPI-PUGE-AT-0058]|nr:hypothetical protein BKA65DRAFT_556825 [Rhexocercosporidium sp. MPI-PUGE-AT-0058]
METLHVYLHWLNIESIEETVNLLPGPSLSSVASSSTAVQTQSPVLVANKYILSIALAHNRICSLLSSYSLGDYLSAPSFQNTIIDTLITEYSDLHATDSQIPLYIPFITTNFTPNSAMQGLVADTIYACLSPETMTKAVRLGLLNGDVMANVAAIGMRNEAMRRSGREMLPWERKRCRYHVHSEGSLNGACEEMYSVDREFEEYLNPPAWTSWTHGEIW